MIIEVMMPWSMIIFTLVMSILNISNEGEVSKYYSIYTIIIFLIIIFKYLKEVYCTKFIKKKEIILMSIMMIYLIAYAVTITKYGYMINEIRILLISFLAYTIPNIIVGILIVRKNKFYEFLNKTYRLCIVLQIIFMIIVIPKIIINNMNPSNILAGNTNQSIGYTNALFITITIYFTFYYKYKNDLKVKKIFNIVLIILNVFVLIYSGARGAAVSSIFISFFLILKQLNIRKINLNKVIINILILILTIFVIKILNNNFDTGILEKGFNRIISFIDLQTGNIDMSNSSGRDILYSTTMEFITNKPILGYGMGAYYYEFGRYPHNIILQILFENGILGFSVLIFMVITLLNKIKHSLRRSDFTFIFIIFLNSFINLIFSGEYTVHGNLWFSISLMYLYNYIAID